ncbi:MAG: DUF1127 domain-containing protein [Cellvibrionaceae bacterium]
MKPTREILSENIATRYVFLPTVEKNKENFILRQYGKQVISSVSIYLQRHRTRKQLKTLSIDQLRDVGLSIEQAYKESAKFFWVN